MIDRCEQTEAYGTPPAFRLPVKLDSAGIFGDSEVRVIKIGWRWEFI